MEIPRDARELLALLAGQFPVVTVTGPRQSGKTTLCRSVFPEKPYVLLETPSTREYAVRDPTSFLDDYPSGAIFDEIQRVPELTSYLQGRVDADPVPGKYVLTGSHNFDVIDVVSQSLAGRSAQLRLLPLTFAEVERFGRPAPGLLELITTGTYPAVHDRKIRPDLWYESYVQTYLERDLRHLLRVGDLTTFDRFLRLCAGRTAQLVNLSGLASDCGISHNTARAWLSTLEASYLVLQLAPYYRNLNKRLVKSTKLLFADPGLPAHLLGIHDAEQLRHHPLRGPLFESFVVTELVKALFNSGVRATLSHLRDTRGREVDCLVERGQTLVAIEVKAAATVTDDFFHGLRYLGQLIAGDALVTDYRPAVVYTGSERQTRQGVSVLPWQHAAPWLLEQLRAS